MSAAQSPTPFTAASRNAVWVYLRVAPPRFPNAPSIVETARAHEKPDFDSLPEGADVSVELYGGAVTLKLDGAQRRVYTRRFEFVSFASDEEARHRFLTLWREVESLDSAAEVERAAEEWLERRRQRT